MLYVGSVSIEMYCMCVLQKSSLCKVSVYYFIQCIFFTMYVYVYVLWQGESLSASIIMQIVHMLYS